MIQNVTKSGDRGERIGCPRACVGKACQPPTHSPEAASAMSIENQNLKPDLAVSCFLRSEKSCPACFRGPNGNDFFNTTGQRSVTNCRSDRPEARDLLLASACPVSPTPFCPPQDRSLFEVSIEIPSSQNTGGLRPAKTADGPVRMCPKKAAGRVPLQSSHQMNAPSQGHHRPPVCQTKRCWKK